MTEHIGCILRDYRSDKCAACDGLCPHYTSFHGHDGMSGRTASAGIPQDYRQVTIGNSPAREGQGDIYRRLDAYVATFKRHLTGGERAKSLYLWSRSPGTGKTTTASALLNAWLAAEYLTALKAGDKPPQSNAYFLDLTELQTDYNMATMIKDEDKLRGVVRRLERAKQATFAVIDDIGTRSSTEAFTSYVHSVINHRTANGLPTVYTSNLTIEEMADVFDARIYDRMRDQCHAFEFIGKSQRGKR